MGKNKAKTDKTGQDPGSNLFDRLEEIDIAKAPKPNAPANEWSKYLAIQISTLNRNMIEIAKTAEFAHSSTLQVVETVTELNNNVATISTSLTNLVAENNYLKAHVENLEERLLRIECQQRRENLVFVGITDSENESSENCLQKVKNVLSHIPEINPDEVRISRCHRLGKYNKDYNRDVICHFNWFGDRQQIYKSRDKLPRGCFVNEDFPPEIQDRRRCLRPILKKASSMDKYKGKCSLSVDKLIIDNRVYTVKNLDQLPNDLKRETVAEKVNDNVLVYFGENSMLSNFYRADFTIDGIKYNCNEQYIQSKKCELFDDDYTREKVMKTTSPYQMKQLGKHVKNFNQGRWSRSAKKIAKDGAMAKFSQNPNLRKKLISTGTRMLGEASTETPWGIGVRLHDNGVLNSQNWEPQSIMSDVLIAVRDAIK